MQQVIERQNTEEIDVLVVGELNVDLILNQVESFPEVGKEKLVESMNLVLGSSSAIFASNLSSLGTGVGFLGKVGNDLFGQFVISELRKKGVNTGLIIKDENLSTGMTVVINFGEDRAMLTFPGAMNELRISDVPAENLKNIKHLHFSSYFLQPGMAKNIDLLFQKAKSSGMTTSFDTQWDPAEKWDLEYEKILPYVDIFLPNEKELLNITKETDLDRGLKKLSEYARCIVVKMGNKGSVLFGNNTKISKSAFKNEKVVDAIGAGDSFNAGFIFKYVQGCGLEECLEFGNLMGAVNTTAAGGTKAFVSYDEIIKTAKEKFGYTGEIT